MAVQVVKLGLIDYQQALELQKKMLNLRQQGLINDTLLLLEHHPVITVGKRGEQTNILVPKEYLEKQGVSVYEIDRGGDVTYHGPGQIVGYPILDLNNFGKDIRQFVRNIEEIFIQLLKEQYGILAGRDPDNTGVWVGNEKITAIGFAIKRWVTMHGFAFNVNTQMEHFKWIIPCGIRDKGVTSVEKLIGKRQDVPVLMGHVADYFHKIFDVKLQEVDPQDFLNDMHLAVDSHRRSSK